MPELIGATSGHQQLVGVDDASCDCCGGSEVREEKPKRNKMFIENKKSKKEKKLIISITN